MRFPLMITLSLLLLTSASAFANPNTLFSLHDVSHGGMGSFSTGATQFNGEWVPASGGRGQWIINHKLGIGLGGYDFHSINDHKYNGGSYELNVDFGGFDIEYMINPDDVVHYTLYAIIGGGQIDARSQGAQFSESDDYFSFYPQANAEVNVTRWFRVSAGVGYRFASGVNVVGLDNGDLSGLMTNLTFKFGKF